MSKFVWVCENCGHESNGYFGQCSSCGAWGSLKKEVIIKSKSKIATKHSLFINSEDEILSLEDIQESSVSRLDTGSDEFNRVLGGGIVPASVNLIGGQPGIGKSTLLLQLAFHFSSENFKVLYISAEESSTQLKMRSERIKFFRSAIPSRKNLKSFSEKNILIYTESNLEKILEAIKKLEVHLIIVDSIQAIYNPNLDSVPGTISQIKECCSNLTRVAKTLAIPMFIVGHINKDGDIAGPKILEHMVDTVLQFEMIKDESLRILRSIKNRFGSTDELAVFEMRENGLNDISDPSLIFLNQRAGGVVTAIKEGQRPILVEIQSLVLYTEQHNPRRVANGIDFTRLHQILAIMEKYLKIPLAKHDVYVNVAGGLTVREPASDLAIALSILEKSNSALTSRVLAEQNFIALGELGLGGEIRHVANIETRLKEAQKLGFNTAIIPPLSAELRASFAYLKINFKEVATLQEAAAVFKGRVAERTSSRLRRTNDRSVPSVISSDAEDASHLGGSYPSKQKHKLDKSSLHEDDENAEIGVSLHALKALT